jgi:hypothetical protein
MELTVVVEGNGDTNVGRGRAAPLGAGQVHFY